MFNFQPSAHGSVFATVRGRVICYNADTKTGAVATSMPGGLEEAYLHKDYVFPPLPPGLELCVGLEVVYEHHRPSRPCTATRAYAYNVRVITPLPWAPPPSQYGMQLWQQQQQQHPARTAMQPAATQSGQPQLAPGALGTRGPSAAPAPQPLGQRQVQDGYGAGRTVLPRGLPGTCVNSSSTHTATSTTTVSGVHSAQPVGAAPGHASVPRHAKDGSGKDPATGPGMPPPRLLTALPPLPSSPTTVSNTVAAARPPGMRPAGAAMSLGGSMAPTVLAGSGAAAAARAVFMRCGPRGAPLLSCTVAGVKAQKRQQAQAQHRGPQQVAPASSSRGWWPSADEWASARGGGRTSAPQPAPQIRPLPGTRVLPAAEAGHAGRRLLPDGAPPSLTAAPLPPPPPQLLQPRPAAGPSVAGTAAAAQAVTAGWLLADDGWGPLGSKGSRPAAAEDLSRRPTGGGLARLYEDHSLSSDDDVDAGDGGRGGYGGRQGGNGGGGCHGARGSGGGGGAGGSGRGGALLVDLTGSGGEEDGDGEEGEIPTGPSSVAMTATTTANGGSSSAQGLRAPNGSRGLSRHGGSGSGGGGCDLADEFHRLRLGQPEAPRHHHPHYHHRSHSRNEHYRGQRDGLDPHHHHQHPQWHRNRDRSRDRSHDRWHVAARQGYGPPWGKAAESAVAAAAWAALHSRPRSPQRQTASGKALACGPEAARGRSPQRRGGAPQQPPQPPPPPLQQQQQQQQHRPAQLRGLPPPVAKLQAPAASKAMQGSQPQGPGPKAVVPAATTAAAALQRKTRRRRGRGGGGDGGRAADAGGQAQGGGPVGVQVQDGRRRVVSMAAVLAAAAQVRQRRRSSIACGLDGPAAALRAAALVTRSRASKALVVLDSDSDDDTSPPEGLNRPSSQFGSGSSGASGAHAASSATTASGQAQPQQLARDALPSTGATDACKPTAPAARPQGSQAAVVGAPGSRKPPRAAQDSESEGEDVEEGEYVGSGMSPAPAARSNAPARASADGQAGVPVRERSSSASSDMSSGSSVGAGPCAPHLDLWIREGAYGSRGSNGGTSTSGADYDRTKYATAAAGAVAAVSRSSGRAAAGMTVAEAAAGQQGGGVGAAVSTGMATGPVPGAQAMRLFCGHCGKEQTWDVDGSRARPLPDPAAPDGHKRTRDGSRLLFDAKGAACGHCGCLAMTSPLSAVCSYCDAIMSGFRPTYWKCVNVDGTARRRVMCGASAGSSAASKAAGKASAQGDKEGASGATAAAAAGAGAAASSAAPLRACEYSRTCPMCEQHDYRYPGKPRCRCPRLHGAIAGQVTGNKAGHLGWVVVH